MNIVRRLLNRKEIVMPTGNEPNIGVLVPPANESMSKLRSVNIDKATNGFIIKVGCRTFVAKTWKEASTGIGEYWDNPIEAKKKYCK
jgi:hypothetical protein